MGDGPLDISVTVLIPTRNEEEAIQETIRSVPNNGWCKELDFLIIDADSRDRTRELAEAEGAKVHIERRRGYGRAYKTGFPMAKGEVIVTMDADCTYPGEEVPALVRKLVEDDLDWITCDRLSLAEEGVDVRAPWVRELGPVDNCESFVLVRCKRFPKWNVGVSEVDIQRQTIEAQA